MVGGLRERDYQRAVQRRNDACLRYDNFQQTARYFERETRLARQFNSWNSRDQASSQAENKLKAEKLQSRQNALKKLLSEEEDILRREYEKSRSQNTENKDSIRVLKERLREKRAEQSLYLPRNHRCYQTRILNNMDNLFAEEREPLDQTSTQRSAHAHSGRKVRDTNLRSLGQLPQLDNEKFAEAADSQIDNRGNDDPEESTESLEETNLEEAVQGFHEENEERRHSRELQNFENSDVNVEISKDKNHGSIASVLYYPDEPHFGERRHNTQNAEYGKTDRTSDNTNMRDSTVHYKDPHRGNISTDPSHPTESHTGERRHVSNETYYGNPEANTKIGDVNHDDASRPKEIRHGEQREAAGYVNREKASSVEYYPNEIHFGERRHNTQNVNYGKTDRTLDNTNMRDSTVLYKDPHRGNISTDPSHPTESHTGERRHASNETYYDYTDANTKSGAENDGNASCPKETRHEEQREAAGYVNRENSTSVEYYPNEIHFGERRHNMQNVNYGKTDRTLDNTNMRDSTVLYKDPHRENISTDPSHLTESHSGERRHASNETYYENSDVNTKRGVENDRDASSPNEIHFGERRRAVENANNQASEGEIRRNASSIEYYPNEIHHGERRHAKQSVNYGNTDRSLDNTNMRDSNAFYQDPHRGNLSTDPSHPTRNHSGERRHAWGNTNYGNTNRSMENTNLRNNDAISEDQNPRNPSVVSFPDESNSSEGKGNTENSSALVSPTENRENLHSDSSHALHPANSGAEVSVDFADNSNSSVEKEELGSCRMATFLTHNYLKDQIRDLANRELSACKKQFWAEALRLRDLRSELEIRREQELFDNGDLPMDEEMRKAGRANIRERKQLLETREGVSQNRALYSEEAKLLWEQVVREDEDALKREELLEKLEEEWHALALQDKERVSRAAEELARSTLQEELELTASALQKLEVLSDCSRSSRCRNKENALKSFGFWE